MTVRIWSSDVSAWEAGGEEEAAARSAAAAAQRLLAAAALAPRDRAHPHAAQQQRVPGLLRRPLGRGQRTADVRRGRGRAVLSVPRAQRDRLLLLRRATTAKAAEEARTATRGRQPPPPPPCSRASCSGTAAARTRWRWCQGPRSELATCGEDGVVATFDLRERGRGGGGGGRRRKLRAPPLPRRLTAAVGPAALAAAARVPGGSCSPPRTEDAPARPRLAGSVDVSMYSVSFDVSRPWLLAVGGDASERGSGECPRAW